MTMRFTRKLPYEAQLTDALNNNTKAIEQLTSVIEKMTLTMEDHEVRITKLENR